MVKNYIVGNVTVAPGVDPKGINCECKIEGDLKVKKISVGLDLGTNNKYYTKTENFLRFIIKFVITITLHITLLMRNY